MRVIAITGASAGIGRATALRLARDGAAVVICARRADRLDAVAAEIVAAGGQALPVVADVTRAADMDALVARAVERFGRLDVMMCNAGFGIAGAIDDVTPDQMQKLMDVNYTGTYHATRAALPVFRRQQSRPHHHRLVDRRQARRAVHGRVRGDQVRAGRPRGMPARGAAGHRHSRQRGLSGLDRHRVLRRDGARDRRAGDARAGPRQTRRDGRRRDRPRDRAAGRRGLPARHLARARDRSTRWRRASATGSSSASAASRCDERKRAPRERRATTDHDRRSPGAATAPRSTSSALASEASAER